MTSITQNFIEKQIYLLGFKQIKFIIQRQRLKFSIPEISRYIDVVFVHQKQHQSFKSIYKQSKLAITYQAFMKNLAVLSPLVKFLFTRLNKLWNITVSSLFNVVDTSLIQSKYAESIQQSDFNRNKVTIRTKNKIKVYICGIKLLVFLNRHKQIYYAEVLSINYSDQNILKSSALYQSKIKGFLLADKGFNCKAVEKRMNSIDGAKIICPKHYKSKNQLNEKEREFYKHRWTIETAFKQLKNTYGDFKLDIKGAKSKKLIEAKLFSSLILFNSSTI